MFESDRVIAIDIGASKLVVAEFLAPKGTAPQLVNYGIANLDADPESSQNLSALIATGTRDLMREAGIKHGPMYMTVSGQSVFPRYVKLPPVTRDKVAQMVQYEAEQNVPFPINEVVWDYQLITDTDDGELHVMLVAAKIENVSQFTDCMAAAGLEPDIVDVAPMALYNCVRYNYPDLPGCTMVLDIGARSSNLIFLEGSRIFSRSIPVAGNTITQELMKEFEISYEEAEALKIEHGFVAFGGVYAGADDEVADMVSKLIRNVVTRLHAEVNRSINFYRSQQGGESPSVVLLTGGSAIIPHLDTFFREKLQVEVEHLNPFANIVVNPALDAERINQEFNVLGEVTGLALRRGLACPVEINLMPPEIVAKKVFRRRQPFFAASVIGVVCIMLCWWVYFYRMSTVLNNRGNVVAQEIASLDAKAKTLATQAQKRQVAQIKIATVTTVIDKRTLWSEMLNDIRGNLLDGMWVTSLRMVADNKMKEANPDVQIIEMEGSGFHDKLQKEDKPDANAIMIFRDKLRASKYFTQRTEIKQYSPGSYTRRFKMWIYIGKDESEQAVDDSEKSPEKTEG